MYFLNEDFVLILKMQLQAQSSHALCTSEFLRLQLGLGAGEEFALVRFKSTGP